MPRTSSSTPRSPSSSAGSPAGGSLAVSSSSRQKKSKSSVPPEPSPRAVAYVRESTEEQGQGFSPDAQREAIRTFAAENGLALVGEYCDFHSGWKRADGRPEFQRLMSDAAERRFDCVLVYHTSRSARNQVEARRYKQMLRERLGIKALSVTQPMGDDHSDPSAFLAESIHEMFDEYYSVSLSFWTRTGRVRRKAGRSRRTQCARSFSTVPIAATSAVCEARTAPSAVCTSRSSPKSCSIACRKCVPGARASSSPVLHRRTTCCASSCTASGAAHACTGLAARDPRCGATSARRAAMETAAINRSPARSRSRHNSSLGSPTSSPTKSYAPRSLRRFAA